MIKLSINGNDLLIKLLDIPPDFLSLRLELEKGIYTAEDVSMAATQFCQECFNECMDEDFETHRFMEPVVLAGRHSTYICDIMRLLLDYGLNPNAIYDDSNIMRELKYIDNEYIAADALALLLEHGGDVGLIADGEAVFGDMDFEVVFDAFNQYDRRRYDALVHCWFVYIGYGAKLRNGMVPVTIVENRAMNSEYNLKKFELSDLREHRNYTFGLSKIPSRGENRSLQIFDKRTRWEVARL